MEGSDGSPPLSLGEIVRAAELFPKASLEREDDKLVVPFTELSGESVKYLGRTDDGVLALSNYRLFSLKSSTNSETSVPLGLIETAQVRDLFHLVVSCKDANTIKCSFVTSENCAEWQRRITLSVGVPDKLESLFAFPFYAWTSETINNDIEWTGRLRKNYNCDKDFMREVKRLHFDLGKTWRISEVNKDFKLCPSYPRYILVPNSISDETLQTVASFRSSRRIPAVVWRHRKTGAVIARCSQPEVGWLGWRNSKDEQLLKALADSCDGLDERQPQRERQNSNISAVITSSPNESNGGTGTGGGGVVVGVVGGNGGVGNEKEIVEIFNEPKKILIVDARSYTSAVTNRARGGGCECAEYYPCAEIQFMNLGNIHAIRKSFQALRQLCASPPDIPNWLGLLERTVWLQHMSGLLSASMVVCHTIEKKGRPVLVHCSDGWDRTPQIVATAQLCLDPYYRTVDGFRVLVEREWLNFGHKFADRCGHGPESDESNERCPVFLQWLDCVHQIHRQFPCSFEFSMGYLIKLAQHSNSCLFGTFLCNTVKERNENTVNERTFSVWPFLSGPIYKNPLYVPNREKVLWPAHNVRDLVLWSEVYLGSLGNQNSLDGPPENAVGDGSGQDSMNYMTKTRSYGDLTSATELQGGMMRRSSDPSMTMESHILTPLNMSSENSIDTSSERTNSPIMGGGCGITELALIDSTIIGDHRHPNSIAGGESELQENIIATLMRDTTKQLENLTNDLNQSDEEYDNNQQTLFINNNLNNLKIVKKNDGDGGKIIGSQRGGGGGVGIDGELDKNHVINGGGDGEADDEDEGDKFSQYIYRGSNNGGDNISRKNKEILITKYENGTNHVEIDFGDVNGGKIELSSTQATSATGNGDPKIVNIEAVEEDEREQENYINGDEDNVDGFHGTDFMLQSIDLNDTSLNNSPVKSHSSANQNLWYGSVETSTDTLVPIEKPTNVAITNNSTQSEVDSCNQMKSQQTNGNTMNGDQFDGGGNSRKDVSGGGSVSGGEGSGSGDDEIKLINSRYVGGGGNGGSQPITGYGYGRLSDNNLNLHQQSNGGRKSRTISCGSSSQMDESIVIQPEFERLDINGKLDRRKNSFTSFNNKLNFSHDLSPNKNYLINGSTSPSVTNSRFSTPGGRSLPLTPPSGTIIDRPPVTISCPDGLAHALSEQNLRLQQIVYEHKLREEALQRELYATRLELLKKTCQQCSTHAYLNNDEPEEFELEELNLEVATIYSNHNELLNANNCVNYYNSPTNNYRRRTNSLTSINDSNLENASVCSWEAVDDGSNLNSAQPFNDLWVPDHAVSQCTGCNMVFWLGRRKHHCRLMNFVRKYHHPNRSCGQIFCADCSEYRASLPDKRLYTTVRLCATCYNNQASTGIITGNNSTSIIQERTNNSFNNYNSSSQKCPIPNKSMDLSSYNNYAGDVNNFYNLNKNEFTSTTQSAVTTTTTTTTNLTSNTTNNFTANAAPTTTSTTTILPPPPQAQMPPYAPMTRDTFKVTTTN